MAEEYPPCWKRVILKKDWRIFKKILCCLGTLIIIHAYCNLCASEVGEGEEETYSISLVKTAGVKEDIHHVEDKKVLAHSHKVKKGDHIWQLLREKGLLEKQNLPQLLSILKKLNPSLDNLDLIHPGENLIIPLRVVPVKGAPVAGVVEEKTSVASLKDLELENYTVKPDDTLISVIEGRYKIPPHFLYEEYLELVKEMNPSVKDLNVIYPGQNIRLPVYSPQVVRRRIEPPVETKTREQQANPLRVHLARIFGEMGEEWVQTGEHFIPLKDKGQINLKADTFPVINLRNGYRVLVDLNNELPENMARLIEASWETYQVVHLTREETLKSALDKILNHCHYQKIYRSEEALQLDGDIRLTVKGDWVILVNPVGPDNRVDVLVLTLRDGNQAMTPWVIKEYLAGVGIKVVDYPKGEMPSSISLDNWEPMTAGSDPSLLVEAVLNLLKKTFSRGLEIPVHGKQSSDYKLVIKADFFLNVKGKDSIIDVTGLSPNMVSFLEEHQFGVLTVSREDGGEAILTKLLNFLDVPFSAGPHDFNAAVKEKAANIKLSIPGIIFSDADGQPILATPLEMPPEITAFLSQKGMKTLILASG